ncbi:MAG: hypothetical protein EBT63_01320 [Proteobacteria bacterium]|nr:hypothetical protein [Pseudomonadota bacterium]NCA29001.1 hypothetical protein [Pseudomonadota bacterium]
MKNYLRLTLVSIISVAFLSSCCKLGFKKSCSADCHSQRHEETNSQSATTDNKAVEVKKSKKSKKSKKVEAPKVEAPKAN